MNKGFFWPTFLLKTTTNTTNIFKKYHLKNMEELVRMLVIRNVYQYFKFSSFWANGSIVLPNHLEVSAAMWLALDNKIGAELMKVHVWFTISLPASRWPCFCQLHGSLSETIVEHTTCQLDMEMYIVKNTSLLWEVTNLGGIIHILVYCD